MTHNNSIINSSANQIALLVKNGVISQQSLGMSDADLERIYAQAKKLYDSGKFRVSRALFSVLALVKPNCPSVLLGHASCSLMLNDLDGAIEMFLEYGALVPTDPMPYFYVSNCYEKKNDLSSTMIALQTVINRAGDQPQYREIKERAILTLEYLLKNLNEKLALKQT